MKTLMWYVVLGVLMIFIMWGFCCYCANYMAQELVKESQRQEEEYRKAFGKIQQRHGAVAVSTDFTHFIRLNGEVCRIKEQEKPNK